MKIHFRLYPYLPIVQFNNRPVGNLYILTLKNMRQKLYLSNRPLAHLFQQFRRQNVSDRLANGCTISFHHSQTGFAVLISNLWLSLSCYCKMVHTEFVKGMAVGFMRAWKTQDKLGESSMSTIRSSNGGGRDREMAKGVNAALDKVDRGKPHRSLTGNWSLPARGNDSTVFQNSLSFGISVQESIHTAYRRLAEAGIRCYRPAVRIPLTPRHKLARKEWCQHQIPILQWPSRSPDLLQSNMPGMFLVDECGMPIPYLLHLLPIFSKDS